MLVQVVDDKQIVNVYIQQMKGDLLHDLEREDREYVRTRVKDCILEIMDKFRIMYTERKQT